MRQHTRRQRAFLLAAASAALYVTTFAATTFLTVSPTNFQGWQLQVTTAATATPTPSVTFVNGPGTPPLGTGSAEFRVGVNGNDAAQLRHPGYAGTVLPNPTPTTPAANELSTLSYSTYVQQDGSGGQAPYIILQIDTDGDAGIEDLLFFEPNYQSAAFCPSNPQPALVTGAWQTWDAFNGCWYSVFGTAGSGPGSNTVSLRTLSAALPTGVIANSSPSGLGGIRLVTGFVAGAWDDFVGNADAFRIGVGANDTVYNFDPTQSPPLAGNLIISEYRTRGPAGAQDEFIELYNNTDSAHVVSPPDGSGGYGVAAEDGMLRCSIPFGTVIPARAHFLCANSDGYSLGGYAAADDTYTLDVNESQGLALFSTDNPANFNAGTRLDAVGPTSAAALYREGAGLPTIGSAPIDYSFYRDACGKSGSITTLGACTTGGLPKDTGDNAADFVFVDTNGTSAGAGQRLGAPGPENLASPIQRNASFAVNSLDPCVGSASAPNRVRDFTSDPANNSTFGTLDFRKTVTNNTGSSVTRLRFRIVDLTTFPAPSGFADLRPRTSTSVVVTVDRAPCGSGTSNVTVEGTTLEQPPSQPNGGGFNSSLSAGTVTLATPLANGASLDVRFLLGIQQTGTFKFFINVEAVAGGTPPPPAAGAATATPSGKMRRLITESQSLTPQQEAAPRAQPAQQSPGAWIYVPRTVRRAPDENPGPEKRPASKREGARSKKGDEDASEKAPPEVEGGTEEPAMREEAPAEPPA